MSDDILIINATVLSMAGSSRPRLEADSYLYIQAGRISSMGRMAELPQTIHSRVMEHRIDAMGMLAMPGLINGHTHGAMTLFRGLADDLPLMTWLNKHIFPAEARHVDAEMVYWCTKLAAAEMILAGTTSCGDGYFYEDAAAKAFLETGLRAVAAQGIIDYPAPGVPDPAANISAARKFLETWQGRDDRVRPAVFAHSPYTCSADTLKKAKGLAREFHVPFFIHVAETREESRQIRVQHGLATVRYLEALELLDQDTVCVHCVWLEPEEIELLVRSGTKVVTCPTSNMKLGAGVAPVVTLLAGGAIVGLGTDGSASNNKLDLFAEMSQCANLHKVHHLDPTVTPAREILKMATVNGARVLGLGNDIGELAPGKKADIILLDLHQPHLVPMYTADLLVYGAVGADVTTVIIDGHLIMRERKILSFDVEETMVKVLEYSKAVSSAQEPCCRGQNS
jgi:5-methylthioadenosine/S-adenosylhomocysteine deaminase